MKTSNLFTETDASSAMNASIHMSDDERTNVLILYSPLELIVSTLLISVEVRVVLQIALSSLITDGTVERVVG